MIFRNVCIVPLAGFRFIINLIKQKDDYDKNSFTTLEKPTPQNASANWIVFQNLEIDDLFKSQFDLWSNWIDSLKPTVSSTKTSFWASLLIGICWNITFFLIYWVKTSKTIFNKKNVNFRNQLLKFYLVQKYLAIFRKINVYKFFKRYQLVCKKKWQL